MWTRTPLKIQHIIPLVQDGQRDEGRDEEGRKSAAGDDELAGPDLHQARHRRAEGVGRLQGRRKAFVFRLSLSSELSNHFPGNYSYFPDIRTPSSFSTGTQKGATDAEVERALRRRHGPELPPPTAFGFPTMRVLLTRERRNQIELSSFQSNLSFCLV